MNSLFVDSTSFWNALADDILAAKKRVYLQAMSFEGDSVGQRLFDVLMESAATDRAICVDTFSNFYINDFFVYGPHRLSSCALRQEIRDTRQLFRRFAQHGVRVKFTNPAGPLMINLARRNHKKLAIIDDDVCYIGGINFCEHNFAWHDMMLRIYNSELTRLFIKDFYMSMRGCNQSAHYAVGDTEVFFLNGSVSHALYAQLLHLIEAAEETIQVISPYLTLPFLEALGQRASAGIDVTILSPARNNKPIAQSYLLYGQRRFPFKVKMYQPGMSHLKAMLIDGRVLIVGSSNFDFVSYYLHAEIVLVIRDPGTIRAFEEQVLEADLAASTTATPSTAVLKLFLSNVAVQLAARWCRFIA